MKKLLFTLCLALAATASHAQMSLVDSLADYQGRFTKLNKAYAKDPDNVEALYNMAQFYFDNSHPMRNLPMAMKYAQQAEARQITLLEDNKDGEVARLGRKGITIFTIRQLKQAITDAAYNTLEVRTDLSAVELDSYMDAFGINMDMVRLLRQRRIGQVYNECVHAGTVQAYHHFIEVYPGTAEAERMEARIAALAPAMFEGVESEPAADSIAARFPLSPSVQRAALRQKSRIAYAEACKRNTEQAYKDFLRRYPASDEHEAVRDRLDRMLASRFASLRTARQYADFADSNSDLTLADSALARLRTMIVKHNDVEAARLYISRFKTDPFYNEMYNRYYSWHTLEGNAAPINKFMSDHPDYPFQSNVENDLRRAQEIDQIHLMEDFLEMEFPRYASYVRKLMDKRIALVPLQRSLQYYLTTRNYGKALERINQFDICFEGDARAKYLELKQLVQRPTGRQLNSELTASYHILNPIENAADHRLYFTRASGASRRICYAVRDGNTWRPAGDVRFTNANSDGLSIYSFYDNGSRMLLGAGGNIWIAERDGDNWRIAEIPPHPVNTDYREADAYMLPDGSGMLLASDRPEGMNLQPSGSYFHGDTAMASDLYFIPYTQLGWGTPISLGPAINTPYSERSPILSRNLKTLYYITDGRGGLGYGDIYMVTRESVEDWTHWSKPVNIGRELNSGYNEASISFSPDEKSIFLSANTNMGRYSVFSFRTWHDATNAYHTCTLEVLGMEHALTRVRVVDLAQQAVCQAIDCFGEVRGIDLNLHQDKRYAILGEAGVYFVPALIIDGKPKSSQRLKGYTFPVLVNMDKPLPLEAVGFEAESSTLTPVARMQMEQLAQFVQNSEGAKVEFSIDVAGRDDAACYNLSLERGRALRNFLTERGVAASQVIISAYGNVHTKKKGGDAVAVRFREQ